MAAALAAVLGPVGVSSVWCGDHSLDRGTGAVPAYLAAQLGLAQALGLVDVELEAAAGSVTAWAGSTAAGASACGWTAPASSRSRERRPASGAPPWARC